jgi:hypothetical protein
MTGQRTEIPKPLSPRDECLQDGRHVLRGLLAGSEVLCCYDPQRQSAATYHVEQKLWRIQVPVSLGEYLGGLRHAGVELAEGADLQAWLDAVASRQGAAN